MHKIFHKSLSRRAVYEKVSLATKEDYPLLFCATCWIESQLVAKKAQIIRPKIVAVVDFWSTLPKHLFENISNRFRMVPFLKIHVIRYMCSKFILNDVLEKAKTTTSLIKLNMLDRNIQKVTTEVSFGLESRLKDLKKEEKVKESEVHLFLQEVKQFLATLCNHLLTKSPINSHFARCCRSLNPVYMAEYPETYKKLFDKFLEKPVICKHVTVTPADAAKNEYSNFFANSCKEKSCSFSRLSNR